MVPAERPLASVPRPRNTGLSSPIPEVSHSANGTAVRRLARIVKLVPASAFEIWSTYLSLMTKSVSVLNAAVGSSRSETKKFEIVELQLRTSTG